jgi:hypothetical protein
MRLDLADEATELGRVVARAVENAGGDLIAREIEADPTSRSSRIDPLLGALGVWDLSPRADVVELEAAAEVCRAVGHYALPYPVAERLSRLDDGNDGLVLVADARPRADISEVPLRFTALGVRGGRADISVAGSRLGSKLGPFVVDIELAREAEAPVELTSLALVLPCWTLLGMMERALELTCQHTIDRVQFGRRLADFQGVQFQLTDASVAVQGLAELARYALWSLHADPAHAHVDALALRLAALDAAGTVFRITHQLHGATGFCDEHALSWLSRYSQTLRRLPVGAAETEVLLVEAVERDGLAGLFEPSTAAYPRLAQPVSAS